MGQTAITGAFFVLLITSVLSANRMMSESAMSSYEGEALNNAADIARTLMNEAQRKAFDLNVVENTYQNASAFTSASSLGPAGNESISPWPDVAGASTFKSIATYNDFDDYNGYRRTVNVGNITGYVVEVSVYYVYTSNMSKVNWSTYVKRMDVKVSHPLYLKTPVTFSCMKTL
jgi:hypothetical protein